MFKIPIEYSEIKKNDRIVIEDNIVFLSNSDELVLYSGKNKYGEIVIASFFEGNLHKSLYIYCIIEAYEYKEFLERKITLREIYDKRENLFMVRLVGESAKCFEVPKKILPEKSLPTYQSYLPKSFRQ